MFEQINELGSEVDIVFVDGKTTTDRAAMLVTKVKRIDSNIKIKRISEAEGNVPHIPSPC
jgi:hypothetical protein